MASREALQKLIQFGNAEQFATHAEDWSVCSSAAILNAAVEQLGKLTQQRAYKDNAGTTVQDWNARRTELQESLKLARRRQLSEAREVLIRAAKALNLSVEDVAAKAPLTAIAHAAPSCTWFLVPGPEIREPGGRGGQESSQAVFYACAHLGAIKRKKCIMLNAYEPCAKQPS